jgi:hypothetical protein
VTHLALQSGLSQPVFAAVVAALVTVALGALITALRYVFGVELLTTDDVDRMIADEKAIHQDDVDAIFERLDRLEDLLMGGEYQIDDGMLELVELNADSIEDHDERIDGVERIQLKIRRRQREHSGGDSVADSDDETPPPE